MAEPKEKASHGNRANLIQGRKEWLHPVRINFSSGKSLLRLE